MRFSKLGTGKAEVSFVSLCLTVYNSFSATLLCFPSSFPPFIGQVMRKQDSRGNAFALCLWKIYLVKEAFHG